MSALLLNNLQKEIAPKNVLVRIFEIPRKEGRLLPPVSERQHFLSVFWKVLVKRGGDDSVRSVRAVHDFAHRIRSLVVANRTADNLIFFLLRILLFLHEDAGLMVALKFLGNTANFAAAHT